MNSKLFILSASMLVLLSSGCSNKSHIDVNEKPSSIEQLLADSGARSSVELAKLTALSNAMARDRMSTEEMRQAYAQYKKVPRGLGKRVTINKSTSTVEEALRFIGTQTNYVIKTFGSQPTPEPILSLKCDQCQLIDLIRNMGYQLESYNGDIVVIEGNEIRVIYHD